jgi:hypothetical protein
LHSSPAYALAGEAAIAKLVSIAAEANNTPIPRLIDLLINLWFTDPGSRSIYPEPDHPHHSRVLVSDLRAAVARAVTTTHGRRRWSPGYREFPELWDAGDVTVRRGERKRVNHPALDVVDVEGGGIDAVGARTGPIELAE